MISQEFFKILILKSHTFFTAVVNLMFFLKKTVDESTNLNGH